MELIEKRIEELNVATYNPRIELRPGMAEYEKLKVSIQTFGNVEPIVWNKRTGNVVGGHQRLSVLKDLGAETTLVSVVDLSDMEEKLLNVALNKIKGDWDKEKLEAILSDFDQSEAFIAGFDIHKFYMENSRQSGYKRLNRAIKQPIIYDMREYTHRLGMRFHVSDAFCRECNDACNCCGVPPEWGVSQEGNIGNAIIIAQEKGEVHFRDIMKPIYELFGFPWAKADNYNTGSNKARALNFDMTMAEFLRNNWNNVKKGTSPAGGYGGILKPMGKDENGDVVYKYAKQRREEENGKVD